MFMPKYSKDPRWIKARFAGECPKCEALIRKGDKIFYFPNGRHVLCSAEDCGGKASREFEAAAQDEAIMSGR